MYAHPRNINLINVGIEALLQICTARENVAKLDAAAAVPLLVGALRTCLCFPPIAVNIVTVLVLLCEDNPVNALRVRSSGGIVAVVTISLRCLHRATITRLLCHALLVFATGTQECAPISLVDSGGMHVLVLCLKHPSSSPRNIQVVCACLSRLVHNQDNRQYLADNEGIPLLVNVMRVHAHNVLVRESAGAALGALAWKDFVCWCHIARVHGCAIANSAQRAAGLLICADRTVTRFHYAS